MKERPYDWYRTSTEPIFHDQSVQEQLACDWMKGEIQVRIAMKMQRECIENIISLGVKKPGHPRRVLYYDN